MFGFWSELNVQKDLEFTFSWYLLYITVGVISGFYRTTPNTGLSKFDANRP
jgi:hypothetical protein